MHTIPWFKYLHCVWYNICISVSLLCQVYFFINCFQGYVGQFVHTIQMFDSEKPTDIQKVKTALWALVCNCYTYL